jgi:hypothetical protein
VKARIDLVAYSTHIEDLRQSIDDDADANVWLNWPQYVSEFNQQLKQIIDSGIKTNVQSIAKVPDNQLPYLGGLGAGSPAERAKMREISSACKRLLRSLKVHGFPMESNAPSALVLSICAGFHSAALILRKRYNNRSPLEMTDEYDVQDLMHALLSVSFNDVRAEEWTPSYAGSSKRMDFLLKEEQIVLETKMTRAGLGAKEIGDQLLIDIAHYRQHPSCKTLICFVYDPLHLIGNPQGLQRDLSKIHDGMPVLVRIFPPL